MRVATKDNELAMGSIVLEFQPSNQEIDSFLVDLLAYDDEQFIHRAYRALLGRDPDPEGLGNYIERLREGVPKLQLASDLRMSDEGVRWAAKMPGLAKGYSALVNVQAAVPHRIIALQQLLALSDLAFVEFAYEKLLGHRPDANQSAFYLNQVYAGNSKVGILAQLFCTLDAHIGRANLNEWNTALAKHGNDEYIAIKGVKDVARSRDSAAIISTVPPLAELLTYRTDEFVTVVFQGVLGRKPDAPALDFYVRRLSSGVSKLTVLAEVSRSEEAKMERDFLDSIANAVRIYKLAHLPWLGWIFRLAMGVEGESELERRLRRIESQIFLLRNNGRLKLDHNLAESIAAHSSNIPYAPDDSKTNGKHSQTGGDFVARPFRAAASMLRTLPPTNGSNHDK